MNFFINHFEGDATDCYAVIGTALQKYAIPDVTYEWTRESRFGHGMLSGIEEQANCMVVGDTVCKSLIFVYNYGKHFFVSVRHEFQDAIKLANRQEKGTYRYLDQVKTACFQSLVERAVEEGVKEFIAERPQRSEEEDKAFSDFFIED